MGFWLRGPLAYPVTWNSIFIKGNTSASPSRRSRDRLSQSSFLYNFTALNISKKMDWGSSGEEPTSWDDLYSVHLIPSELFFKFRKEVQGLRVGLNLEFYNAPVNEFQGKLVLKPLAPERMWKFIYEPIHSDIRILSKKIPLTGFLNLQVGLGHNFQVNATGWKWKLSTCFGGDGISRIRNKTSVGLFPGVNFRFGWRADYVLPEVTGALGTGEPWFNMNSGKLQASLDRVEAIINYTDLHNVYKPKDQFVQQDQQITGTDVTTYSSPDHSSNGETSHAKGLQ